MSQRSNHWPSTYTVVYTWVSSSILIVCFFSSLFQASPTRSHELRTKIPHDHDERRSYSSLSPPPSVPGGPGSQHVGYVSRFHQASPRNPDRRRGFEPDPARGRPVSARPAPVQLLPALSRRNQRSREPALLVSPLPEGFLL